MESSPGNKVNLASELKGKKGVIVGVPAAYCKSQYQLNLMPTCSSDFKRLYRPIADVL